MATPAHHVIIGNGIAGTHAATVLRKKDPESKITIVTKSRLLCYNRYDLPEVFAGQKENWRDFLVYSPEFYVENKINVMRNCTVVDVDSDEQFLLFSHKEKMHYDTLLVASGVSAYLPEDLVDYKSLMNCVTTFEDAMNARKETPKNGHVIILGGDMAGLDMARRIVPYGYRASVVINEYTFWPHQLNDDEKKTFLSNIEAKGVEIIDNGAIASIKKGEKGKQARCVVFKNGSKLYGDVVMPYFGLAPVADFMLNSGVGIERGIMATKELKSSNDNIWTAGDVAQIWSEEENKYRFFYGWKNVRLMGAVAAENMTGGNVSFKTVQNEKLRLGKDGKINSPFWEYD